MNIFLYFLPWGSFYCFSTYMYFLRWRMKAIRHIHIMLLFDRALTDCWIPGYCPEYQWTTVKKIIIIKIKNIYQPNRARSEVFLWLPLWIAFPLFYVEHARLARQGQRLKMTSTMAPRQIISEGVPNPMQAWSKEQVLQVNKTRT